MTSAELLIDAFGRIQEVVHEAVDELTAEELVYRPDDQANSIAYHLGVFSTKHWLSGAIYFALQDFAARPNWGGGDPWPNPPWVQKGLVDLSGNLKPAFAVVSSIFHATRQIAPQRRTVHRGARPTPTARRPIAARRSEL